MDSDQTTNTGSKVMELATTIVSSFVAHNSIRAEDIPNLIRSVRSALSEEGGESEQRGKTPLERPMSVKKSITPDYLISMEDGKQYRTLKRHLAKRGLTPDQYREKWGLGRDYPMTAASYSARRSEMARSLGLGQARKGKTKAASKGKKGRSARKAA